MTGRPTTGRVVTGRVVTEPALGWTRRTSASAPVGYLLCGFAVAVLLRSAVGGVAVRDSATAGLIFAGVLTALSVAAGVRLSVSRRSIAVGLAGGAVLCLPAVAGRLSSVALHRPAGSFVAWAVVVSLVAGAEEAFLRGALFEVVTARAGAVAAVVVTAACFGLMHVPLYGWSALPLDFAAGLWLGMLRVEAGSLAAPAVAHIVADVVGWWLR